MVRIERGVEPEEVRQAAKHTLFVEGKDESAIDPRVLTNLLRDIPIQIKPLGPSSYIRSAAEALHKHHPYYYFLVDRDHHDEQTVEECWRKFPHEDTCNLLIWHRRELENYFLIPEYLIKSSKWLRVTQEELKTRIRDAARARIFLDAANMVIVACREEMKKKWIDVFRSTNDGNFATKEKALEQLLNRASFVQKERDVRKKLHKDFITERFNQTIDMLFGGGTDLDFGQGKWLEMVSGKGILPGIINTCFQVKDAKGHSLQGETRLMEVVEGLLRLPIEEQPDDFQELCRLITAQVK